MDLSGQGFRSRSFHLHRWSFQGAKEGYEEYQLWTPVWGWPAQLEQVVGSHQQERHSVDVLIKKLGDADAKPAGNQNVQTTKEKFLAHVHNAITKNQNINEKN